MTMQRRGVVMVLAALFWVYAVVGAQVAVSPTRRVVSRPGVALADVVMRGEEALVVESNRARPLEVLPLPGVSTIEWKTEIAHAIVVVDVLSVAAEVTREQDWIKSRVTVMLLDVLKSPKTWIPSVGEQLTFDEDGGEAYVAGTKVVALLPWASPVEVGKRYLMFVTPLPEKNTVMAGPTSIYEMTDAGTLRGLATSKTGLDDLEKVASADALLRIRNAVR